MWRLTHGPAASVIASEIGPIYLGHMIAVMKFLKILLPFLNSFFECFLPLFGVVNNLDCIYFCEKKRPGCFQGHKETLSLGSYREGNQKG